MLFTSRLNAGIPTAGTGYELNAIAACVIGGASLFGAKGGAFGAAAGALIVGTLNNGGNLLAINSFYLQIIIGVAHPGGRRLRPVAGPAGPREMSIGQDAGRPADPADLVDVDALIAAYYDERPDPARPGQRVAFGTSGHRGTSLERTFNEAHVAGDQPRRCAATASAQGIDGPLFLGRDTHALSRAGGRARSSRCSPAHGVDVVVDADDGFTPTPVISHAILTHNRGGGDGIADGIVVTPSHNPPEDGGFKYNPPHGGPADTDVTGWIEREANELLEGGLDDVQRAPSTAGRCGAATTSRAYVDDLPAVIDLDAIRDGRRAHRRRPARRREPRLLAGDRRALRARPRRSSTTRSTRRSASCRSTGTARSAWTAPRRTRWPG